MDGKLNRRNKAAFPNFPIRISVNGASDVSTTRALNLDFPQLFPSSRVAKAEIATKKTSETSRKLDRAERRLRD